MIPYPSIETVFRRDPETHRLDFSAIRQDEVELVNEWVLTEKIDGTNIRLIFSEAGLDVRGRTDKAQFKPSQLAFLEGLVDVEAAKAALRHPTRADWCVTIYGELYGPGVQKGGVYRRDLGFRAFDILYGGAVWAGREVFIQTCALLGIETAPWVATLPHLSRWAPRSAQDMDDLIGCSAVALRENGQTVRPEGFVAKPPLVLLNARGERVMFKLTYRDLPETTEQAA